MPLERAIQEHCFVYGREAGERGMRPPPAALDLSVVTRDVARLFEQAFARDAARAGRPSAKQWVAALDELGRLVQRCRTNPSHAYLKGRKCPFCAIDRETDLALFHQPLSRASGRSRVEPVHLPTLWKEIAAIEPPPKAEILPAPLLAFEHRCAAAARGRPRRWWTRALVVGLSLLLAYPTGGLSFVLLLFLPRVVPCQRAPGGNALAKRVRNLVRRWNERAAADAFHERRSELARARSELESLDEEHARGLAELEQKRRGHQLDAFLRQQRLATAGLAHLDRGTLAVLESYGIETAFDVVPHALARVSSLAEGVRKALISWRARTEKRFVFDPSRGVDPDARAALERAIQRRHADLVQRLVDGPARLRNTAQQIEVARRTLGGEIQPLLAEVEAARRAAA
jgi:DNA-binding helix-hairpin-helix protein with protein kinase domain